MLSSAAYAVVSRYYSRRLMKKEEPSLHSLAARSEQITARHFVRRPELLYDEQHFHRIRGGDLPPARLIPELLQRTELELRPCHVHEFRHAWLIDGSLYLNADRRIDLRTLFESRPLLSRKSLQPKGRLSEIPHASLAASVSGSSWFGHWLMDEVPLQLLGEWHAPALGHPRQSYRDEAYYRKLLGLSEPARPSLARIDKLVSVDEFAQNPHKTLRYQHLRTRMRHAAPPCDGRRVYLRRGADGQARHLVNENILVERLVQEGFTVLDICSVTFAELRANLLAAELVMGLDGSHLNHALAMMPDHAGLILLNPPGRFMLNIPDRAAFLGIDCATFCCEALDDARELFRADPDEVLRFADSMQSRMNQRRHLVHGFVDEVIDLVPEQHKAGWSRSARTPSGAMRAPVSEALLQSA